MIAVKRLDKRYRMVSVRLTYEQFRELQKTLRNFEIQGDSLSEQLRVFLKGAFTRSVGHAFRSRRKRERIQKEREKLSQAAVQIRRETTPEAQDPEEEKDYHVWFNNLGNDRIY